LIYLEASVKLPPEEPIKANDGSFHVVGKSLIALANRQYLFVGQSPIFIRWPNRARDLLPDGRKNSCCCKVYHGCNLACMGNDIGGPPPNFPVPSYGPLTVGICGRPQRKRHLFLGFRFPRRYLLIKFFLVYQLKSHFYKSHIWSKKRFSDQPTIRILTILTILTKITIFGH
jgi:hypothetical protein